MAESKLKVAVIGGGVIGAASAWRLAAAGCNVTVFDSANVPNDRGASAGESRIFRTAYKEGTEYHPLLKASLNHWNALEESTGLKFLEMCGGLTIGREDHPDVAAVITSAQQVGADIEVLDAKQTRQLYPQHRVDDDEVAVRDAVAGVFRPELTVRALRTAAETLGAVFRTYSPVLGLRPTASQVHVEMADGSEPFDRVVVAPGPWAKAFAHYVGERVTPKELVGVWFRVLDQEASGPQRMPIAIRRHESGGFSSFPMLDGFSVKILPHHLPWNEVDDVSDLSRFIDPSFVRSAERLATDLLPLVEPTAIRVSTWSDGFTATGVPKVGISQEDERIVFATGMSGQGFKMAPGVGDLVVSAVKDGSTEAIPESFKK
ncbi:FAD-dependent oxidoreductase [Brevibacterium sp. HMSC24B04]|uniref:FAD-dependent oxidoreductase n=1 Tax=Brevibacterium sp. HMSC24B04 TaxID=1581060 RepID=UPI000ACFC128|nr:FAD-dependent oxidoreductase [Brevibacterium sp. HMSC24B04]